MYMYVYTVECFCLPNLHVELIHNYCTCTVYLITGCILNEEQFQTLCPKHKETTHVQVYTCTKKIHMYMYKNMPAIQIEKCYIAILIQY